MDEQNPSHMYDSFYFATSCGRPYGRDEVWLNFFDSIAERIAGDIQPSTVLDAGCAWGFLVEKLRRRGMEAYGIDISEYAIQNAHPDIQPYCWVGSVGDPLPQKYDLIVSIEVVEHMDRETAERAIANFCRHSDDILFSSTPFDYKEATHFNVHPPEHWSELFARHGFYRDVDFDASFITPWAVRYRRKQEPLPRMVREYERKFFLLWKENVDLRALTVEMRNELSAYAEQTQELRAKIDMLDQTLANERQEFSQQISQLTTSHNQLQDIQASRSWQTLQKLQAVRRRFIPEGSRREQVFQKTLDLLRGRRGS